MRRLSRLLSRSSISSDVAVPKDVIQQKVPLLELPAEILLTIEAYLQLEHVLCLSLTCKRAHGLFFSRHKPDQEHHSRERLFLRLLERDHPTLISCPWHLTLYVWPKRAGKRYRCPLCTGNEHSMVTCNKGCRVGFHGIFDTERRLMIRHGFLGPQFGISMRSLNHVCKRSKSKIANQVNPKVAGGSLMVWRTFHYTARIDFQTWSDLGLDKDFNEAICVHSDRSIRSLVVIAICHARRRRHWLAGESNPGKKYLDQPVSWYSPLLFKCPQCSTDVRIRMDQTSPIQIDVRLDVFQDLGGLQEMTVSQRQVLGMRFNSNHRMLSRTDKIKRLRENLENRYFGQSEIASKYCDEIPWDHTFLGQWFHNFRRETEWPIICRPDGTVPRPIWLSHNLKLRFKRERGTRCQN